MENGNNVNNNGVEVFSNEGAKNGKAMEALQQSFGEAKGILENNRMLIQEIGRNHNTHEAGSLSRNITLIRELDNNMVRIMELYSNLSFSLSLAKGSPTDVDADADTNPDAVKEG